MVDPEAMDRLNRTLPGLGVTLTLTIRLHENGAMSVEGPTGDPAFCKKLLEEAWQAIQRQPRFTKEIVIPERDLDSRVKKEYVSA
jgi:hypothetical protein